MLYVDSRLTLSGNLLMYSDKMSMAVSLEIRVPYLDLDLMEYVDMVHDVNVNQIVDAIVEQSKSATIICQ